MDNRKLAQQRPDISGLAELQASQERAERAASTSALLAAAPSQVRYHRAKLNASLGRDPGCRLDDVLDDFFMSKSATAPDQLGIYSSYDGSSGRCLTEERHPGRGFEPLSGNCLTQEKPSAVAAALSRGIARPPIATLTSKEGKYAFSVLYDVPILLDYSEGEPVVIRDLSSPDYDGIYAVGGKRLWRKPDTLAGRACVIYDQFVGYNYCHWLLDWLPRLLLLSQAGIDIKNTKILLTRKPTMFQKVTLERLGIRGTNLVWAANKTDYSPGFVGITSFAGTTGTCRDFAHALHAGSSWAADLIRSAFGIKHSSSPGQRLILNRRSNRRLIFDDVTEKLLERSGFKTIYAEEVSFETQIKEFSNASHIIAAHGAGLANLVFCPERARILEIFPQNYSTSAYLITANAVGLNYACAVGERVGEEVAGQHVRDYDIKCGVDIVHSWLALD